jgi:uncharacterized protein YdaU (DUF1376 family)
LSTYYKTAEDFDWYKHYPAAFTTTTAHLSHVELGVYRKLLDHYWTADNTLPRDIELIVERTGEKVFNWRRYGITVPAGFDPEEVTMRIVEYLLSEFFEQDEDGNWRHIWLDEYRRASDEQFQARSKASRERAARQGRGQRGKFSKVVTEQAPNRTAESTVPDGEVTVEQSRGEQSKTEQIRTEEIRTEKITAEAESGTLAHHPEETRQERASDPASVTTDQKGSLHQTAHPEGEAQGRPATDSSSAPLSPDEDRYKRLNRMRSQQGRPDLCWEQFQRDYCKAA